MNFFSPMTCPGSWTFIKVQVHRYCLVSLEAYRQQTDRQTDRRTDRRRDQFLGALYDNHPFGV